ncbi:DsbA family protein [Flavisolibacter sp. BT320]|nr:DsbA family protein [Flavisolibacter longurius]
MEKQIESILSCDAVQGSCEIIDTDVKQSLNKAAKPVRLLYFTDPICSSCWGIEPQLRKLELAYGDYFSIEYRMGGLLKSWESYGGSDVRSAADVAQHWDEASELYGMPIDGDVWKEDPLASSYPPSIAVKAAQLQDSEKAVRFLRRIREMVFVEKKNITRWEHLAQAALDTGLEVVQFKKDYDTKAKDLFEEDLEKAKERSVRGFPTIFFIDEDENQFKVYGSKPYEVYEQALLKLVPNAVAKPVPASYETVLHHYGSLTTKEFAVLNSKSVKEAETILAYLQQRNEAEKFDTKNGPLWRKVTAKE